MKSHKNQKFILLLANKFVWCIGVIHNVIKHSRQRLLCVVGAETITCVNIVFSSDAMENTLIFKKMDFSFITKIWRDTQRGRKEMILLPSAWYETTEKSKSTTTTKKRKKENKQIGSMQTHTNPPIEIKKVNNNLNLYITWVYQIQYRTHKKPSNIIPLLILSIYLYQHTTHTHTHKYLCVLRSHRHFY